MRYPARGPLVAFGLAVFLIGTTPDPVAGQQARSAKPSLTGRVISDAAETPVAGARVSLVNVRRATTTDSGGRFRFDNLRPGVIRVEAVIGGREPLMAVIRLAAGERKDVEFRTAEGEGSPHTIHVDGEPEADGTLELTKFERRMASGVGRFITRDEIIERNPFRMLDIVRFLPGVRYACRGATCGIRLNHDPRGCDPAIIVDDVQTSLAVLESASPNDVQGIEVYRGPSETPPEINNDAARCGGAIVVWTRRGQSP